MNERNSRGGPKTPEGKARSSMNALKHGLYAITPRAMRTIAEEAGITYEAILEDMCGYYRPADPVEMQLVKRIARCSWRLALAEGMEKRVLQRHAPANRPGTSYDRILKYERHVDIHFHRAIAALMRKRQAENNSNAQNEPFPRSIRA